MLFPDTELELFHTKMFKDLFRSEISTKTIAYLLSATSHQRVSPLSYCIDRNGDLGRRCLYKPYNYSDIIVDKITN